MIHGTPIYLELKCSRTRLISLPENLKVGLGVTCPETEGRKHENKAVVLP